MLRLCSAKLFTSVRTGLSNSLQCGPTMKYSLSVAPDLKRLDTCLRINFPHACLELIQDYASFADDVIIELILIIASEPSLQISSMHKIYYKTNMLGILP